MVKRIWSLVRHPIVAAILVAGVISLMLAKGSEPALAYDLYLDIDCNDNPVFEGDTFRLHIESTHPYVYAKETLKVYWTTITQTADESDYRPLHHEGQASNGYQTENSRMGRTFYTKEDHYSEFPETFKVRADNAESDGEGAGSCTIEIEDNDGPGAVTTWIEGTPDNYGENHSVADSDSSLARTYHAGETIRVKQQFTEEVTVQDGDVNLGLQIGDSENYARKAASYVSGEGTDTLTFEYEVSSGDLDSDGFAVADSDYGGPGTIASVADGTVANSIYHGTTAGITHQVNGGPYVSEIKISSTPSDGKIYRLGETIEVEARFDRTIQVDGTSAVRLQIGAGDDAWVGADYADGSDSDTLLFQYEVQANDVDPDGIRVERGYVDADGQIHGIGAHGATTSSTGSHLMDPSYDGLEDQSAHLVDGRPYITDVSVTSTPANGVAYRYRERVHVSLTFDRVVSVSGLPNIAVRVGESGNGRVELAKYSSGSLTDTLTFDYKVEEGDVDNNGVSVLERIGFLAHGEVRVPEGGRLVNDFIPGLADQEGHKIDGRPPYVVSASFSSTPAAGQVYRQGESIDVSMTFDQEVDVLGRPSIIIELGDSDSRRGAIYSSGTGTDTLVFSYQVHSDDRDDDGVALASRDSEGIEGPYRVYQAGTENQVQGTIPGIESQGDHKVDGRPYVTNASVISAPARRGIYREGETIGLSLVFDQMVEVDGESSIRLAMGDAEVDASYRSGSGTETLVFGYVVQEDDRDTDGITLPVQDSDGFGGDGTISTVGTRVEANGAIPGLDDLDGHSVAGRVYVTSVSVTSDPGNDETYENGDTIEVSVHFDDEVTVSGDPQVIPDLDGESRTAEFLTARAASASAEVSESSEVEEAEATGEVLVFAYTVQEGDEDTDGIAIPENALQLNGGSIEGPNSKAAKLEHGEFIAEGHLVGAVPPIFESAATSEDGSQVLVTFSEMVHVRPGIRTLSKFAGVDVGIYLRTLVDVFVDEHRPNINGAEVSGAVLTLTMVSPITQGQWVELAYDNIFSEDVSGLLIDDAGNALEAFSGHEVANNSTVPDIENPLWPKVSADSLTVEEGGSVTYTMKLGSQPEEDVAVSLSVFPTGHLTADQQDLNFTADNWDTPQTITLSASWDDDDLNSWQEIIHTSEAEGFISGHLKVLVED